MKIKSIAEQHAQWCVHYKRDPGLADNDACRKGVVYQELARTKELGKFGCFLRLPCLARNHDAENRKGEPLCECPHLQWPTKEQCDEAQREADEATKRMMIVGKAIMPLRKEHKGKSWRGVIECPVCKGKLHVSIAGCNGHAMVGCETKDCVAWIE